MSKVATLKTPANFKYGSPRAVFTYLRFLLPSGGSLPAEVWEHRHRFLLGLTWLHALLIALIGPVFGYSWEISIKAFLEDGTVLHTVGEGLAVALFAGIATWGTNRRLARATAVGFGLMSASAILVHLSGGYIEFHFHFFVMIAFLALYQDWAPYLLAIVYVALHHGVVGVLWPQEVYNHPAALNAPWTWAAIHAAFVLAAAGGSIIAWRFNERASAQTKLILESAGEGIFGLDLEGKITFINPAAAEMLGVDKEKIVGQSIQSAQDATAGRKAFGSVGPILAPLRDGIVRRESGTFHRQGGGVFPADFVSTPIVEGDAMTGLVVTFRDVTKRKQAEEAVARKVEELAVANAEVQARYRDLQTLHAISDTILDSFDVKATMERILDKAFEIGNFDVGAVRVLDANGDTLEAVASRGYRDPQNVQSHRRRLDGYTAGAGASRVMRDKAVHVVDVTRTDGMRTFKKEGVCTIVAVPLRSHGEVSGVMQLGSRTRQEFRESELQILEAIGRQAGIAVQKSRLYDESKRAQAALADKAEELAQSNTELQRFAEQNKLAKEKLERVNSVLTVQADELARSNEAVRARYQELQTLHEISHAILDTFDLEVMMGRILDQACDIGGFDIGMIRLLDPMGERLEPVASRGYRDRENLVRHRKIKKDESSGRVIAAVIASREIEVRDLTEIDGMQTFKREGVRSLITVPLRTHRDVLGAMHLGDRAHREFTESELHTLSAIGRQTGIAIQKARLYEESKQAQAALAEKAEELARSNTELQHFAYVASHDLQEPLRMVASYVQLLARRYKGKLDSEADEFIGFAVDGATRMQALINALLAYSRIGTKGKPFEPADCEKILAVALKNLQMAVEESKAVVTHDALPTVMGEASQLGQLFQNLIGNAIKFRGDHPPKIHVSAGRSGKEWLFSFRDNGIGIDPQYAERIFILFQRLHSKEEYPGTGIGLALCKKIVERHGGQIRVESEPGKGATFHFTVAA